MTDLAVAGFNPQQHRLPVSATFSNTHAAEYNEGERREARGAEPVLGLCPSARPQIGMPRYVMSPGGGLLIPYTSI